MACAIRPLFPVLLGLLLLVGAGPGKAADPGNPRPAEGDLVLPLPGGGTMAFRPVYIGAGDGQFAWRRFTMGDPSGGYKESPTAVAIGGSFLDKRGGKARWCYYLGKYEVSAGQWAAVMGEAPPADPGLPARELSWFDVQAFVRAYNDWLFAGHADSLPSYGDLPGYLRLPTEEEWEFAARGAGEVDAAAFDRKFPYSKNKLAAHEWYAGPMSSHNQLKPIGLLDPNPAGLHDMLGNVAEMTSSLYRVEYYQGRSGGFVARGGHYLTADSSLRSALRSEQPFYRWERDGSVKQNRQSTLGFRLAISSLVFPNRQVSQEIEDAWEGYHAGSGAQLPAATSVAATSAQTRVSTSDASARLARLTELLRTSGGLDEEVRREIEYLQTALGDVQATILRAEEDSAFSWAKIAAERGFFIAKENGKLPTVRKLVQIAEQGGDEERTKGYRKKEAEIQENIAQAINTYGESIKQLGSANDEAIARGFDRYVDFLLQSKATDQVNVVNKVMAHVKTFTRDKRILTDEWLKDFAQ